MKKKSKERDGSLGDAAPSQEKVRYTHPLWDRPMTPKQLATFLQVSRATLQRQLRDANFPRLKIAGQTRFIPRRVLQYYERKTKTRGS